MLAPLARYMKDEDSQRSEDAKESPRIEKQVKMESASDEEQELIHRLNIWIIALTLELKFPCWGQEDGPEEGR